MTHSWVPALQPDTHQGHSRRKKGAGSQGKEEGRPRRSARDHVDAFTPAVSLQNSLCPASDTNAARSPGGPASRGSPHTTLRWSRAPGCLLPPRGPSSPVPCSLSLLQRRERPHLSRGFPQALCTRAQAWLFRGRSSTGLRAGALASGSSSSLRPAIGRGLEPSIRVQTDLG